MWFGILRFGGFFSAGVGGRDVLERGGRGGGGSKGAGGGGRLAGTPLLPGSPYGPRRMRAKVFKPKSSWGRRRRSKFWAVSLKHWKGRREVTPLLQCTAVLLHHSRAPRATLGGQLCASAGTPPSPPFGTRTAPVHGKQRPHGGLAHATRPGPHAPRRHLAAARVHVPGAALRGNVVGGNRSSICSPAPLSHSAGLTSPLLHTKVAVRTAPVDRGWLCLRNAGAGGLQGPGQGPLLWGVHVDEPLRGPEWSPARLRRSVSTDLTLFRENAEGEGGLRDLQKRLQKRLLAVDKRLGGNFWRVPTGRRAR